MLAATLMMLDVGTTTPGTPTPSQMAIAAFREACIYGEFKLTPNRGKLLGDADAAILAKHLFGDAVLPSERTGIRLVDPPNTFIIIGHYSPQQHTKYTSRCAIHSGAISKADAFAEISRDGIKAVPIRKYLPDFYFNEWAMPLKYPNSVKYMHLFDSGWIDIEIRQTVKPTIEPFS